MGETILRCFRKEARRGTRPPRRFESGSAILQVIFKPQSAAPKEAPVITTTTPTVEGYRITGYYGIVFGEVITGINFLRDFGAGIRNIVGGRSEGYEEELMQARTQAIAEMEQRAAALGAHAIVGVDVDYEVLGQGNMLMVSASGTAVTVEAIA